MKRLLSGFVIAAFCIIGLVASVDAGWVNGYTRKDGTYVQGHMRSEPNSSYNDNWSVRGNQNPYTGSYGTKSPTLNDRTPDYNRRNYGSPLYQDNLYNPYD